MVSPPKRRFLLKHLTGGSSEGSVEEEGTAIVDTSDPTDCDKPLTDLLKNKFYLAMDWLNNERHKESVIVESKELDHSFDILEAEKTHQKRDEFTLEDCLKLFTEPEVLSPQEAWYCPRCKDHREASKQLTVWRPPPLLIIQLKRFSFKNLIFREKIDKMIKFPVRGLDMSDFCCQNNQQIRSQKRVYDLYGVINHYGGMFGGHYVAASRTSHGKSDLGWRLFDDSRVQEVREENVITKSAYILFYRLRDEEEDGDEDALMTD
jgi:uncharacterized UBP type Zn finger protein